MSREYTVDVSGWFACAWYVMRTRVNMLLRGVAVKLLFFLLMGGIGRLSGGNALTIILLISVGLVLEVGWLLYCLRLVRGEEVSLTVMFEPFSRFGQVWFTYILIQIMIVAGLFLLIIPGLYLIARFGMGILTVADRKLPIEQTLEFTSRITKGHRLQILLLHLITGILSITVLLSGQLYGGNIEAITFLVYQFVLAPLLGTVFAAAYDSLVETRVEEEL